MMTQFILILIVVVLIGGLAGYQTASRDLLQQIFLSRNLSYRLAECLGSGLVLTILLAFAPRPCLKNVETPS